jgi:localization factor PodJL
MTRKGAPANPAAKTAASMSVPGNASPAAKSPSDPSATASRSEPGEAPSTPGNTANGQAGADHPAIAPYGLTDDILSPPAAEEGALDHPAEAPRGTTIATQPMTSDDVADVFEQQLQAGFSNRLGATITSQTPADLAPDANGRVNAAYVPPLATPEANDETAKGLDLPPATVGPLSLRLAAANGDASAQFEVAARLAEGKGTDQDSQEALRWYQRSAAKGFAQAQYRLGTLYERGLGVTADIGRARIWYQRAAEKGNVKSMHNLAVLAAGDAANPNYVLASQWFTKAAEYGLADSQYNLGVLCENGLGMKADKVAAYKWYALAAKSGDKDAAERLQAVKGALSADDLRHAEELLSAFSARASNLMANDARTAGEDWKKRVNNDTNG